MTSSEPRIHASIHTWTLDDIATVTGGEVHDADGSLAVTGPAFLDSREDVPGGLFVAIAGEHVDGHDYAEKAVAAGAAAVLGSRPTGVPTVVVADAQTALQALAAEHLRRLRAGDALQHVIGLTGSQGKTSVKDLLAGVLDAAGPTVATRGSFNNELGLPLTVLRARSDTRFLVLEMGARGIGHIAELCAIAPPDVSVVLNVGMAHVGEFGSRDNIAIAKGELVEALDADGIAVLNADDERVAAMATRTRGRVTTFGRAGEVRLDDVTTDELGRPRFTLDLLGSPYVVQLRLLGAHQAGNAAAVAAVALAVGLAPEVIVSGLESVTALSRWRMELHERGDGLVVINDAYNANPASMQAALETLAGIGSRTGRRTIAVLGEMRELGADSAVEHARLGRSAADLGVDMLVAVGEQADTIASGVPADASIATHREASTEDAATWLGNNVASNDVVLVKASRAGGFESIAERLLLTPHDSHVATRPTDRGDNA